MKIYIRGAEPFELGAGRRGVLLVHGFTGTPFEMRPLGEGLAAAGYRVVCPALAGHATRWEDLEETGWRDWAGSADRAFLRLSGECDKVFIAGISMGGLITLKVAAERPGLVTAAAVMAAPLWVSGLNGVFATAARFTPMRHLWRTVKKPDPPAGSAREIRDMNPSYDRVPTRSAAEFWDLMAHMRRNARNVTAPVLMIYSRGDGDVPYINKWLMGRALGSSLADLMTLDNSPHLMTLGADAPRVIERIGSFFSRY